MISESQARKFCKEDISKIENYEKAIADTTQTWVCHHRNGIDRSREELKRLGLYKHRPAAELIFMTESEHHSLHNTGRTLSDEQRRHLSEVNKGEKHPMYGRTHTEETKQKMRKPHGPMSDETKKKISEAKQNISEETKRKMSEAAKAREARKKQQKQWKLTKSDNR